MPKLTDILNRSLVLYLAFAALCGFLIDGTAARLKILNFHRNAARYVNRFAIQPNVTYDHKKFRQAAIYQSGLVDLLPDQTLSYGVLGFIRVQLGDLKASARAYDQAAEHHPDYFGFHFNRGLVYYQLGHMDRAQEALTVALATTPAASVSHHQKIAARMLPDQRLQKAWLQEKIYRLKSAHNFAQDVLDHIKSGQKMVIDTGRYYYYVPPVETGIIPLQSVVDGYKIP